MNIAIELARNHTMYIGSRSLDVLHVASAIAITTDHFLTFDDRQARLAALAGLKVERIIAQNNPCIELFFCINNLCVFAPWREKYCLKNGKKKCLPPRCKDAKNTIENKKIVLAGKNNSEFGGHCPTYRISGLGDQLINGFQGQKIPMMPQPDDFSGDHIGYHRLVPK